MIVWREGKIIIKGMGGPAAELSIMPEIWLKDENKSTALFLKNIVETQDAGDYIYEGEVLRAVVKVRRELGGVTVRISYSGENKIIERTKLLGGKIFLQDESGVQCELFTYSPDLNRSLVPLKGKISLSMSSLELRVEDSLAKGDGGRFIVPPYFANIRLNNFVLGVGSLIFPRAIQGLQPVIENRNLYFEYDYQGQLYANKTENADEFLFICEGEDYDSALNSYLDALDHIGMICDRKSGSWQPFWSGPIYCTIGDQAYESMLQTGSVSEVNFDYYITREFTEKMLELARNLKLDFRMVILDAGWMKNVGLWDCHEQRFPQMRSFIDSLREKGIHTVLWYTPYDSQFNGECAFLHKEHPDWLLKNRKGERRPLLDYTNPQVREFVRSRLHYLLSADPGCLNADGLKVDFYYHIYDESGFEFYDPSYGAGELLQHKVLKFIYDCCKEIKPQAYIEGSSANPMFNDTQDACRLNDDVTGNPSTFVRRAWITSKTRCNIADTDDWWSYADYFAKLTLKKCVFGIPAIYALKYRGVQGHMLLGYNYVAPGGNPVSIPNSEYRRLGAIFKVYSFAPVNNSQDIVVDYEQEEYIRWGIQKGEKRIVARTLNGGRALLTCTDNEMYLCSLSDENVRVSLPSGETAKWKVAVESGEKRCNVNCCILGNVIGFEAKDCGNAGEVYIIYREGVC